jgi:hypothetical protein
VLNLEFILSTYARVVKGAAGLTVTSRRRFRSQAEAKMAVFEWIEGWYN